jgi:hypothetical protein
MRMVTSTDGGATWGPVMSVSGAPSGLGGQPVVQPNGTVVVPYTANYSAIYVFRSTNGGVSWGQTVPVASQTMHAATSELAVVPDNVHPARRVDLSRRKRRIAHADRVERHRYEHVDRRRHLDSQDANPDRSGEQHVDHFLPGIGVDRATSASTAHLGLGYYYYPVSNCGGSCQLTFGFVSSLDGGATWSAPTQVSGPMNPQWIANTNQGLMVGD